MSLTELANEFAPAVELAEVADYPKFEYSMKDVQRAGEALRGDLIWTPETADEIIKIFQIAHSWRDSHAFPMQSIRQEVSARMRALRLDGITAGRIKRMQSIRKKLRTISTKLNQMQDLGGCRAVLPAISDVRALIERVKNTIKHDLHNESDYIESPKKGGYRCHHLIYKYKGDGIKAAYDGRRIEIQIRTRLQHSWATAVEAVGLFLQQDLKGGNGDPDWLRLFELVSAEFAVAEECPESQHVPERPLRIPEIRELAKKMDAVQMLENLRRAVRQTGPVYYGKSRPSHYRIEYDYEKKTVTVSAHSRPMTGINDNDKAEEAENSGARKINTVYIEADKIDDLKAAYPNYFGDVQVFNSNLQKLIQGKDAIEFTHPPRITVPSPPKEPPDFSWFRQHKYRRWSERAKPAKRPRRP